MKTNTTSDQVHPFIALTETHEVLFQFSVVLMVWLMKNHNPTNRPRCSGRMDSYRNDIRNGRWNYKSGNCIRFDVKGNLIDGQHTIYAHILENKPLTASVIYGLPVESINYIDVGRPRSGADNAVLYECRKAGKLPTEDQFKAKKQLFRIGKWYTIGIRWMIGDTNARRRISETEMGEIVKANEVQLSFAQEAACNRHTKRPGFLSALAIYYTKHPLKAVKFREQMVHGVHAEPAVVALRDYLMRPSIGGDQPMYDHYNTVHAINCFHNNKPVNMNFPFNTRTSWMV